MKCFLYGRRPDRDVNGHPSMGFLRPTEVLFAEDERGALALADPALEFSDPARWTRILAGTDPDWAVVEFTEIVVEFNRPARIMADASRYLGPFGWHYPDQEFCDLCEFWQQDVCTTCGLCPSCKLVAHRDCVTCGPCEETCA